MFDDEPCVDVGDEDPSEDELVDVDDVAPDFFPGTACSSNSKVAVDRQ